MISSASVKRFIVNSITCASVLCSMFALFFIFVQNDYKIAIKFILLAVFVDHFDGRVARFLRITNEFGKNFDSLADMVNFGFMPIIFLVYIFRNSLGIYVCGFFYVICVMWRLARFNVSNDNTSFTGLPSPLGCVVALMPFVTSYIFPVFEPTKHIVICELAIIVSGIFMISQIKTVSLKNIVILKLNHFSLVFCIFVAIMFYNIFIATFVGILIYIIINSLPWLFKKDT